MVLYTRKQFADLTGKSPQQIGVCIKRDLTVIEIDKKIDIQNPTNKAYLAKVTIADVNKEVEKNYNNNKPIESKSEVKNEKTQTENSSEIEIGNIDFILKQHQLKKTIIETNLKKLEYAKKKGKIIPLKLFASNINTFLIGTVGKVKNELHKFIENEFDDNDKALEHKKYISEMIDLSIKNNIKSAIEEMKKEADEYSLMTSW